MNIVGKHVVIYYFLFTNLHRPCLPAAITTDQLINNEVPNLDTLYDDVKREIDIGPKSKAFNLNRDVDPPYLLPEPQPVAAPISAEFAQSSEQALMKKLNQKLEDFNKIQSNLSRRADNVFNGYANNVVSRAILPRAEKPVLFTMTNSDTGLKWNQIPYREKFQWHNPEAPCHPFRLRIPDERVSLSTIDVCIYRDHLHFRDESSVIFLTPDAAVYDETKVCGQVEKYARSTVSGNIIDTYFYGEISMEDPLTKETRVYVVEGISVLSKLVRLNEKVLQNLITVMKSGTPRAGLPVRYNAVVTQRVSLATFMANDDPKTPTWEPLVIVSTGHNSYLIPEDFKMNIEESGRITFQSSTYNVISIETDGSIQLQSGVTKMYSFRPNGRSVLTTGLEVIPLQDNEGSVALTAFTSSTNYNCLLPTPAFYTPKQGGYVCKVCLAVDGLYTKHFKRNHNNSELINSNMYLGGVIDKVSWMFRSSDWNDDNNSDNIGLDWDPQFQWSYADEGQEKVSEDELDVLFKSLTNIDFSECCLGIAYTMKMFPSSTYAKSSASKTSPSGGVCSTRTQGISNNVILISANNKSGGFSEINEENLVYLTAHEIAKAFGASAYVTGQVECDQFNINQTLGHYILWPDVMRKVTPAEKTFSSCSKKHIKRTMETCKSACFEVDLHPFCGNGIVEDGEECDCGSEYNCSLQKCCNARDAKSPCKKTGIKCPKKGSSGPGVLATVQLVSVLVTFSILKNIL